MSKEVNDWVDVPIDDWQDVTQQSSPPSMGESALRGAASSATFGFAPKITGAGEAGLDVLKDPEKLSQLLQLYKQHAAESQQAYKTAEETNPGSYTAGEIGGAFLAPIPGAALAKEATIGAKLANAAATGAKIGGLTALGQSDVNADLGETAKEVGKGALGGGVLGGGLQSVGSALKGTSEYAAKRSKFIQDLLESAKRGYAGEELSGTLGKKATEQSVNKTAEETREALQNEVNRGAKIKESALDIAEQSGEKSDVSSILKKYQDVVDSLPTASEEQLKEKTTLQNLLDGFKEKITQPNYEKYGQEEVRKVGAKELEELTTPFKNATPLGKESLETTGGAKTATDITKDLKSTISGPEMGEAGADIQKGNDIMSAALKAKQLLFPALSGITGAEKAKMENKLSQTIRSMGQNTEGGISARFMVNEALNDLESTNPDLVKQIRSKLEDRATAYDLAKKMGAEATIQGGFFATAKGKVLSGANIAGLAGKGIANSKVGKIASTMKSFISGSTPETLKASREALQASGAPEDLLNKLEIAEKTESNQVRNAILYSVMQQPTYRQLMGISDNGQ